MHACIRWCPILTVLLLVVACEGTEDPSPEADPERPAAEQLRRQVLASINTLVGLQQTYYRENGSYSTDLDALGYDGNPAVSIEVQDADGDGWSVVASHEALEAWSCAAFTGDVETVPTTSGGITPEAGRAECDPLPGEGETEESGDERPEA